jgi:hypothetical protein
MRTGRLHVSKAMAYVVVGVICLFAADTGMHQQAMVQGHLFA